MTRAHTREELIKVGTEIIGLHGFGTTGINAVLSTAGIPKGSFYYYFSSKEDFGLAVIEASAADYARQIDDFLSDTASSPITRIRNYMQAGMARIGAGQCKRGCLIGSLSQELSSHNETFRARLDAVFEGWKQQFSRCLDEAKVAGEIAADADTDQLAEFLLAGWQGAILRAKMNQSTRPMQAFIETVFGQILTPA
ncbi:MAG: TetR family transcriptional regulator C-terminal domain-containing protein [Gammaproteobacteria bacterium]